MAKNDSEAKLEAELAATKAELAKAKTDALEAKTALEKASAKASDLEAELAATKADANASLAELNSKASRAIADLTAEVAQLRGGSSRGAVPAHKRDTEGTRRYVVGDAGAFYGGVLYRAGEVVTLKDGEAPSRTWRKLAEGEAAPVSEVPSTKLADVPAKPTSPTL